MSHNWKVYVLEPRVRYCSLWPDGVKTHPIHEQTHTAAGWVDGRLALSEWTYPPGETRQADTLYVR